MIPRDIEAELVRLIEFASGDAGSCESPLFISSLDRQRTYKAIYQLLWWLRREGLFVSSATNNLRPLELPPSPAWAVDLRKLVEATSLGSWLNIDEDKLNLAPDLAPEICRQIGALVANRFRPKLEH